MYSRLSYGYYLYYKPYMYSFAIILFLYDYKRRNLQSAYKV